MALALAGFAIATFLALYQVEAIASLWEPFFGDGSEVILNSRVSHALPIPDAALGALLPARRGDRRHRRARALAVDARIVITFGLAVGPLGAVSIMLVTFQPVLFDAFCTLCLASAVISVLMIGPAMDELLASLQDVRREAAGGRSAWRAFWGLDGRRPVGRASAVKTGRE